MKAAIYNPYLDTLGGGERYTLSFAKVLMDQGYKVEIQWKNKQIIKRLEKRFNLDVRDIQVIKNIKKGDGYDVCFWLSDGSIPLLRARNNILHFQFPFKGINGNNLLNKMKLYRINSIVCNSMLTKKHIDKEYNVQSQVIYPPVDVEKFKSMRKQNIILYVGRFSQLTQSKNQHLLIDGFKKLVDGGLKDWKLVLAGGVEVGVGDYLKKLKKSAEGYEIKIVESPDFADLKRIYGKAKIFWSASGYGENPQINPKKVEHFGITVVEAMASGCVPVVVDLGGHKEIVKKQNGILWKSLVGMRNSTLKLIKDKKLFSTLSKQSIVDANAFSYKSFNKKVSNLL